MNVSWARVLGQLPIAHHPVDERENRPLVPTDQLAKRPVAPVLGQRDDVCIGEIL